MSNAHPEADTRRTLVILRHAHAEPAKADGDDFDRPLSPRGEAQAAAAAKALVAAGVAPDLVLASPAARTAGTARAVQAAAGLPEDRLAFAETLYDAGPGTLLARVRELSPGHRVVVLVGHNPGVSELARALAPEPLPALDTADAVACTWRGNWGDAERGSHLRANLLRAPGG